MQKNTNRIKKTEWKAQGVTQAKQVNGSNKMWGQEAIIIKLIFFKLNSLAALLPSRTISAMFTCQPISARLACILSTTTLLKLCHNKTNSLNAGIHTNTYSLETTVRPLL